MITVNTETEQSYEFPSPSKEELQGDPKLKWTEENQIFIPSSVFQSKPNYILAGKQKLAVIYHETLII